MTAITNIALENQFFGKPGPSTADEAITRQESRIAPMLQAANCAPEGPIDPTMAAELIVHFTVRAKGMRTFMAQAGNAALDDLDSRISNADGVRSQVSEHPRDNPHILAEAFPDQVRERYGPVALEHLLKHPAYLEIMARLNIVAKSQLRKFDIAVATPAQQSGTPHVLRRPFPVVDRRDRRTEETTPSVEPLYCATRWQFPDAKQAQTSEHVVWIPSR